MEIACVRGDEPGALELIRAVFGGDGVAFGTNADEGLAEGVLAIDRSSCGVETIGMEGEG